MKTEMNNLSNGKLELCDILTKDSPWNKNLKSGWGRIDYNLRHCCNEDKLMEYCKSTLSKITLKDGRTAIVEWDKAYTSYDNRGYGWGVSKPTNTKVTGRWRFVD